MVKVIVIPMPLAEIFPAVSVVHAIMGMLVMVKPVMILMNVH